MNQPEKATAHIRVTPTTKERIRIGADAAGLTHGQYIDALLDQSAQREPQPYETLYEWPNDFILYIDDHHRPRIMTHYDLDVELVPIIDGTEMQIDVDGNLSPAIDAQTDPPLDRPEPDQEAMLQYQRLSQSQRQPTDTAEPDQEVMLP